MDKFLFLLILRMIYNEREWRRFMRIELDEVLEFRPEYSRWTNHLITKIEIKQKQTKTLQVYLHKNSKLCVDTNTSSLFYQ